MQPIAMKSERLIEEVRQRPGLWNMTQSADRIEKLNLWKDIGAALFDDWHNLNKAVAYDRVLQMQKKWRSLRDAYNRELRARRRGVRVNRRVYIYFKKLTFLGGFEGLPEPTKKKRDKWLNLIGRTDLLEKANIKRTSYRVCSQHFEDSMMSEVLKKNLLPHAVPTKYLSIGIQPRRSTTQHANKPNVFNVSTQTIDSTFEDSGEDTGADLLHSDHETEWLEDTLEEVMQDPLVVRKSKRKVKRKKQPFYEEKPEEIEVPAFLNEIHEQDNDSDKLFLISFSQEMKKLPPDIKMWARAQIANVMQEAVSCHFNNAQPSGSSFEGNNSRVDIKRPRHSSSE